VRRTESGGLALEGVAAQIGPIDAPYARATGAIEDLLGLRQLAFSGALYAPASLVLPDFPNDEVVAFGDVHAEFELSDASGELSLSKLEARSRNTDLWDMRASAAVSSVRSVEGADFALDLTVPDGDRFLSALKLKKVDLGPVRFSMSVAGAGSGLDTRISVGTGQSQIDTSLNTVVDQENRSTVRGRIGSEKISIGDLGKAIEAGLQLALLENASETGQSADADGLEVQPLVLADATEPSPVEVKMDAGRVVQPLVLDADDLLSQSEGKPAAEEDGRVVQPMVLERSASDGKPTDLVDLEQIARDLDLEIGIDIAEIIGQEGVSSLTSQLISRNGIADFGPVEFSYGGGYFKVGAGLNFLEAPDVVRIFGSTSGWDFGEILDEVGAGIKARGKLRAQFDLTGDYASAQRFVDSMFGPVTISMVNGAIATSLLDLAGLGLFPWLFSKELQQGYTSIVCAVAPLRIQAGKVSSNAIVVETKSVQVVAAGSADWKNDRISLRAEPRPVGKPLARSAWPFEVTGRLSNPDFNIGAKSRQKREWPKRKQQASGNRTPCKPDARQ
jgi:hypothetical protein